VKRARDTEQWVGDPVGSFEVGATHVAWCHSPTLCGLALWGRPTAEDATALASLLELMRHPDLAGGFEAFMDLRAVTRFVWPAFVVLSEKLGHGLAQGLSQRVRRHAIVVPSGPSAAQLAGLLSLLGPHHPLRLFATVAEASDWLGHVELEDALAEIDRVVTDARAIPVLLRALHATFERSLAQATMASSARALAMSTRTLQRELSRHRTTFSFELTRARLQAACALLVDTDDKIEAIARTVGYCSSSHLCQRFGRHLGMTPAHYRARRAG
jgi:AraC-like DNA-binding protein